jgi:hypothetical protein
MKSNVLVAFHGDPEIKREYLARVEAHRKADEIVSGVYWERGKGCAVGCTIHGNDHRAYERELGIPTVLARLEDRLFEVLYATGNVDLAKAWPERFLSAAKPGADLSLVWPKFAVWLLSDAAAGVIRFAKREATKAAIEGVSALYLRWAAGDKPATSEWESARKIADAAADADAADAAAAAAYAAAAAAAYAAAAAAAYAAAADAADAAAYADASRNARSKHYVLMADKLIEIIEASPVAAKKAA